MTLKIQFRVSCLSSTFTAAKCTQFHDCCSKATPLPKALLSVLRFLGSFLAMPLERPSRGHGSRVSAFSPAAFRPSAAALLLAPDEDQPGNVTKYAPLGEFGETSWETLAVKCFYILITYHNIIQSNSRYQGFLYMITRLVTHENMSIIQTPSQRGICTSRWQINSATCQSV